MNEANILLKIKDGFVIQQKGDLGDGMQDLGDPYVITKNKLFNKCKAELAAELPRPILYIREISDSLMDRIKEVTFDMARVANGYPTEHIQEKDLQNVALDIFHQLDTISKEALKKDMENEIAEMGEEAYYDNLKLREEEYNKEEEEDLTL